LEEQELVIEERDWRDALFNLLASRNMSIEKTVTEYVLNEEEKVEGMESFGLVLTFPPSPHSNDDSKSGISVIGRGVNKKFAKHNTMKQLHQYLDGSLTPTSHFIENEMKCEKEEEEDEKDEVGNNILGTNEACIWRRISLILKGM